MAVAAFEAAFTKKEKERTRLERARRVISILARIDAHNHELSDLDGVADFPDDCKDRVTSAKSTLIETSVLLNQYEEDATRLEDMLVEIKLDDEILNRKEEIDALGSQVAVIVKHKADLINRHAEVSAYSDELREVVSKLGWEFASWETVAKKTAADEISRSMRYVG